MTVKLAVVNVGKAAKAGRSLAANATSGNMPPSESGFKHTPEKTGYLRFVIKQ